MNVGNHPNGVAVTPDGTKVYVANQGSNTVSVIDTATNNVTATVTVGTSLVELQSTRMEQMYMWRTDESNNVSVIDTATNNVTATVNVGTDPVGIAVTPDGTKVYVANDEQQYCLCN